MEYEIAYLEMRGDEIWELLQDNTLPPLDRDELLQEMEWIDNRLMELEDTPSGSFESESIGPDEYDREGLIANEDFDLADEI